MAKEKEGKHKWDKKKHSITPKQKKIVKKVKRTTNHGPE